jgi:hypothetical protein
VTDGKRSGERIDLAGSLPGDVTIVQATAIRQLSRGGMQVESAFPLPLESIHQFRLALGERTIVVKGRVVHSHVSDVDQNGVLYRSGIEFIDLAEPVASAIAEFVEAVKQARARA